jgi:hypothetical protein
MITFRSRSAHVSYWRKSGNICPKLGHLNFDAERLLLGEQRTLIGHAPDLPSLQRAGDDQFAPIQKTYRNQGAKNSLKSMRHASHARNGGGRGQRNA